MEYRVTCSSDLTFTAFDQSIHPRSDVERWLVAHLGKRGHFSSRWLWRGRWTCYRDSGLSGFRFRDARDATLFKLTWGGS